MGAAAYGVPVDAMSALVDSARAEGAFVLRSLVSPPWSMRIDDAAPLCVLVTTRGGAWLLPADGSRTRLATGDVVLLRDVAGSYVLADDPATAPRVAIDPDQNPTVLRAHEPPMRMLGVRSWGNDPDPETILVSGTYRGRGEVSDTLLTLLPPVAVLRASATPDPLVELLADEIVRDELGQERMLDRLLDLVLIRAVRTWFAEVDAGTSWLTASRDPAVGRVLRLVHADPAAPWTVASMARAAALSRSGFARRFTELVGTPPMAYLTDYRLRRAADLLRDPGATLSGIAAEVGYGSAFALSAAFARERGESPRAYRHRVARGAPSA